MAKKQSKLGRILAAATCVLAGFLPNAQAEDSLDLRLRTEYFGNNGDNNHITTTLGIGDEGAYDTSYGDRVSVSGQFFEKFRLYDVIGESDGEAFHYTTLGARLPGFELGNVKNDLLVFGVAGDKEGVGIESRHSLGNAKLILNAEHLGGKDDATRLGTGFNYQIAKNVNLGVGFDNVSDVDGNTNQFLINTLYDPTERDTLGFAYVLRDEADNTQTHGLGGFWLRGKEGKLGVRAFGRVDWNDDQDFRSYGGEVILAQRTTTFRPGATWMVGRTVNDDEMYNTSVVPLSISKTEATRIYDRQEHGWAFSLAGNLTDDTGVRSGYMQGEVGYAFKDNMLRGKLGVSGGLRNDFSEGDNTLSLNSGLVYRTKHLTSESGVNIPFEGNRASFFTGLQVKF